MLNTLRDFKKDTPYKNVIERMIYGSCRMVSHMDIVSGPNIERHVQNGRDLVAISESSQIRIIEIDEHVHNDQANWISNDSLIKGQPIWNIREEVTDNVWIPTNGFKHIKENVSLINKNISDIQDPARFFDADLMGTIDGQTGKAIDTALGRQADIYSSDEARKYKKAFIMTLSVRKSSEWRTIEWIEELMLNKLNSIVSIRNKRSLTKEKNITIQTNGWRGVGISSYDFKFIKRGRIEDFKLYYYNETGSPMVTGVVVYR